MKWPQVVVALVLLVGLVGQLHTIVRRARTFDSQHLPHRQATALALVTIVWPIGFALVLSAGGFW